MEKADKLLASVDSYSKEFTDTFIKDCDSSDFLPENIYELDEDMINPSIKTEVKSIIGRITAIQKGMVGLNNIITSKNGLDLSMKSVDIFLLNLKDMKDGIVRFNRFFPQQKYVNTMTIMIKTYLWIFISAFASMILILFAVRKMRAVLLNEEICLVQDTKEAEIM